METIAICVCTCMRPKMLADCLESLARLKKPENYEVVVVVIDNDPAESACGVAAESGLSSPHPTIYHGEPRRGISFARNRALDVAKTLGANWICFIDDDEVADVDWIANLMAPRYLDTPILLGKQEFVYPEPRPFWSLQEAKRLHPEGREIRTGYTNNIRFSMAVVDAGLRFNEALGLMGGEDQEFCTAAHQAGFGIKQTNLAITYETSHPERLTYMGQASRSFWCAASDLRRLSIERGWGGALARKAHTVPWMLIVGTIEIITSPVFMVTGMRRFKKRALAGGKKVGKGLGRAAAAVGYLPQPYRRIVGR